MDGRQTAGSKGLMMRDASHEFGEGNANHIECKHSLNQCHSTATTTTTTAAAIRTYSGNIEAKMHAKDFMHKHYKQLKLKYSIFVCGIVQCGRIVRCICTKCPHTPLSSAYMAITWHLSVPERVRDRVGLMASSTQRPGDDWQQLRAGLVDTRE